MNVKNAKKLVFVNILKKKQCKECRGTSICEHQRRKDQCKECGGSSICEHKRRRNICKECGGSSICKHRRMKSTCKECKLIVLPPISVIPQQVLSVLPVLPSIKKILSK